MPSGVNLAHAIEYDYRSVDEAFPKIRHGRVPLLNNYIVQVRRAMSKSKGGIVLTQSAKESEVQLCTVGKVVAISPMAFHFADGRPWPEGPSFKVGDFLQIPRFGGNRFSVKLNEEEEIVFVVFDHLQQICKIEDADVALAITSYL
jgi:co-chaperonin GroES (HSP10)